MKGSTGRIFFIDNLRGFLIILVVLGHCIQFSDLDFDHNIVFRYIYSFHMPLFMFISGFVSYKRIHKWSNIQRRFKQLILPFFSWAMLGMTISNKYNWDWVIQPDNGLWFLWVLFWIGVIHSSLTKLSNKTKISEELLFVVVSLIFLVILLVNKLAFGYHLVAWYLPFYLLGTLSRKYQDQFWLFLNRIRWILFCLFLGGGYFWMRKEGPIFMDSPSQMIIFGYKFIIGLIGCLSFMAIFSKFNFKILILSELGGGMTLGIYAIHQSVIKCLLQIQNYSGWNINNYSLEVISLFVATFVVTTIMYYALSRISITKKLFLGKWN